MSHDQTSYPLPPGFLGMGNLSFSPLKKKKQAPTVTTVILSLYPNTQNSCDISQWGLWLYEPCMEIQLGLSQGDRQTRVSFPQPLHMVNLK